MKHQSNEDWIAKLKGERGSAQQNEAFEELGRILHQRVYNYLLGRRSNISRLTSFSNEELAAMAHDFVQETLEIIYANDFAKLEQFNGSGSLEGWATVIARRQAGQELRRKYWHSTEALPDQPDQIDKFQVRSQSQKKPIASALLDEMIADVWPKVERCMEALAERQSSVFLAIVWNDHDAQEVAEQLRVTMNTVYIRLYRAKQALRKCLDAAGIGPDILDVYDDPHP